MARYPNTELFCRCDLRHNEDFCDGPPAAVFAVARIGLFRHSFPLDVLDSVRA